MERNNERCSLPYSLSIWDDFLVAPKRRRYDPIFDEINMLDVCDPAPNSSDPCGSNSFNSCGSNSFNPCDPCGSNSFNACQPCGSNSCDPCGQSCRGTRTRVNEEPTEKDCIWQVYIDVSFYHPEDIVVFAENNKLIVRADPQPPCRPPSLLTGLNREYEVPKEYDLDNVAVYFSEDGILVILIPCVKIREYPIQLVGPARCFISNDCDAAASCSCVLPCKRPAEDLNQKPKGEDSEKKVDA